MLQTEFLRSLNCNYERVLLNKNPEEKRYQYCMISRGGIKGLLSCSLRYINGLAYLYYDITSKQNLTQIYGKRLVKRKWLCDFMWSMQRMGEELSRFLLDKQNILWYPQQIFQDLESEAFSFLYIPYYEGDNGFKKFLEFLIEHIDYEDECLVECVYKMHEEYEQKGDDYLQSRIFKDAKVLEEAASKTVTGKTEQVKPEAENTKKEFAGEEKVDCEEKEAVKGREVSSYKDAANEVEKKGLGAIFKSRRKREQEARDNYRELMKLEMAGYAVAEESGYEEELWGKTIFIEETVEDKKSYSLYTAEGRLFAVLDKDSLTIGKRKEEVDMVIEDISISRMHARILKEENAFYLEDLNSTNGTFKNGLRMEPYEKRKLEAGDEIRLGKKELIFR